MALVSVIIPTRNRSDLAKGAVKNILNQTYCDIEIIVVEDGSNSGIEDYLKTLDDKRIHYCAHNSRKGLAAARNSGTQIANGKYVAFMDDDERWVKDKINLQCDLIESYEGENIMIYCGNLKFNENGLSKEFIPSVKGEMSKYFFNGYCIGSSCLVIPRKSLLSIGGHSENLTSCIDHDLWMKYSKNDFVMDFASENLVYSETHNETKMTVEIEDRIVGIKQFFNKWKEIVIKEYGRSAWRKIEKLYHIQTSENVIKNYNRDIIDFNDALMYFKQIYSFQGARYTLIDDIIIKKSLNKFSSGVYYTPFTSNIYKILFRGSVHGIKKVLNKVKR